MIACRDCKHVVVEHRGCDRPELARMMLDPMDGQEYRQHPSIDVARSFGGCGPEAKLFEPKEPQ